MSSDESDDEPLSNLAAAKKEKPEEFEDQDPVPSKTRSDDSDSDYEVPKKKKKKKKKPPPTPTLKKLGVTIKINRKLNTVIVPPVIARPSDVWLYLKDLNPTGPYSCLLCPDWFINRSKMILHYALNHKKDFCGICRYFVPDRDAWFAHEKFHSPWPCSQCVETFPIEGLLRNHLSSVHNLVHCRLCHFRVSADSDYNSHLFRKHGVTNVASKDEEILWEIDSETPDKFLCLLCIKTENLSLFNVTTFFGHYMGIHHFTLKCLANIIAGRDTPFSVNGAEVSDRFLQQQLKDYGRLGYVDLVPKNLVPYQEPIEYKPSAVLIPEVKEESGENLSDTDEKNEKEQDNDMSEKDENSQNDENMDYKGEEDFDITHTEIILFEKCYYEYIDKSLSYINDKTVPEISHIDYEKRKGHITDINVECTLCKSKFENTQSFTTHLIKMHNVKTLPLFSCRVCATTFDTFADLTKHISEELGDFEDLWICQFCDKEFDNREQTRTHLTEHWASLDHDNCFSPHLGFKCKYCPTLFWNENEREMHQTRVHFNKYRDEFYKCDSCSKTFSDKVWYIHHHVESHSSEEEKPIYLVKCCVCFIVEPNFEKMRNHFEDQHPEIRKLYCSLDACMFKPLSHRKSFKLHVKMIHGPSAKIDKPVNCNLCSREFVSSRSCSAHMAQVHGPGKFKCKLCKEVLQTIDERKLHYLLCHPGRHPFECSECGKSFQYKSSLYMHKQDHLPNKQSYTCSYCGKVFSKKDSYREHVQIHEGPRHACSYCPMRFVQRSNMLRHERRHTGERPYRCAHCSRAFSDKGACTAHTRTHLKDTSYACLYCGQTFVQKSKLTYHIRKHTGENLESCTVCAKIFTSACALREHMKTHVAKREVVKCPLCDKGYQDERYMLRHLRTMHTRAQFSCPLCHKLLTSAAGLRHHVITHSNINTFLCKCCTKTYAVKRTMIKHLRKRHGLRGAEVDLKDFFNRIEPRDCKLNLDEETMTSIFGPPKMKIPDILLSNFVNFANQPKVADTTATDDGDESEEENEDDNKPSEASESEKEDSNEEKEKEPQIKQEHHSGDEELEPTDFVSVKIEPLDEEPE